MRIVQITPGSGESFYCENCLRDEAATGGGVLFRPSDPGSLAEALAKVLGDAGLAAKLSRDGRRAVLEKFTAARMAERLAAICRETIDQHG